MNPQLYGYIMDKLFQKGAFDVHLTAVIMKKGRPGTKISVMVSTENIDEIVKTILCETSSLGVRIFECGTVHLSKEVVNVGTDWGTIRVNVGSAGNEILNIAPEFEDCKTAAVKHGVALKLIYYHIIAQCKKQIFG
jgi:pyridinium-3,5-bisthiocarboxylic acid mononucleotide nickel chelatase